MGARLLPISHHSLRRVTRMVHRSEQIQTEPDALRATEGEREALHVFQSEWPDVSASLESEDGALIARMLSDLEYVDDVRVHVSGDAKSGWRVGVCLADRVGTLSLVSGLCTSAGLDIVRADTFSVVMDAQAARPSPNRLQTRGQRGSSRARLRQPLGARQSPRECAIMLFDLVARAGSQPDLQAFEAELRLLTKQVWSGRREDARSFVIDRFADALRDSEQNAEAHMPVSISTETTAHESHTLLTINSIDTPGFLFAFSNALSSLRVNVARSMVRTEGRHVRDVFWLAQPSGGKIESESQLRQVRAAAALIKRFIHLLPSTPDPGQALRQFNSLTSQILGRPGWAADLRGLESPGVLETLAEMMGASRFLWEDFLKVQRENLFPLLLDAGALDYCPSKSEIRAVAPSGMGDGKPYGERVRALNELKDREMFRADLRYITGRSDLRSFGAELTTLAEVLVEEAFALGMESARERFGAARRADGAECGWAIFALGKFGGRDMGFGSDIELLFVYESEGETDGRQRAQTSTWFEVAIREFLRALETRQQGIFEVDMRLRPYGSNGPLASSLAAFEHYYGANGDARQFERLALVRARAVAGDERIAARVMRVQESFVYSAAPLDLGNIRHLRGRQADELVGRGALNAKLSAGGLVDIEYCIQAWQIARGRDDPSLRLANTLDAVDALRRAGHLSEDVAAGISESYVFLRELIDALRVVRGSAKDLDIPPAGSREFRYLAHRMGVSPPSRLQESISAHMERSRRVWDRLPAGRGVTRMDDDSGRG